MGFAARLAGRWSNGQTEVGSGFLFGYVLTPTKKRPPAYQTGGPHNEITKRYLFVQFLNNRFYVIFYFPIA